MLGCLEMFSMELKPENFLQIELQTITQKEMQIETGATEFSVSLKSLNQLCLAY